MTLYYRAASADEEDPVLGMLLPKAPDWASLRTCREHGQGSKPCRYERREAVTDASVGGVG